MDDLDNILNDEVAEAPIEQVEPQVETPTEQLRDETGKFAPKGETVSASPAPVEQLDHAAIVGERRRRQEAEAERDDARRQLEAMRNPPAPPPSVFEDEEGWQQHMTGEVVSQAVQTSTYQSKLQTSEFYARKNIEGFDQSWPEINQWLSTNPNIATQVAQEFDPWGAAWTQFQNAKMVQELGAVSVADLETKLREKITAELSAQPSAIPSLPNSLADSQSSRTNAGAVRAPLTLEEILGR